MTSPHEQIVDRALREASGGDAPPPDLVPDVLAKVTAIDAGLPWWTRWRRRARGRQLTNFVARARVGSSQTPQIIGGGTLVRTKILATVGGLALIAGISFFVFGYPPTGDGTEATIGAAKRYQGAQLTAKDIQVPDSDVQQFIQSETFDRLLKDEKTRAALQDVFGNPDIAAAFGKPGVAEALGQPATIELLGRPIAGEVLGRPAVIEALSHPAAIEAFSKPGVLDALNKPDVLDALSRADVLEALAKGDRSIVLAHPAVKIVFSKPEVVAAISQPAMLQAFNQMAGKPEGLGFMFEMLGRPGVEALGRPGVGEALSRPAMLQFLGKPGTLEALKHPAMLLALSQPAFGKLLAQDSLRASVGPLVAAAR